MTNWGPWTGGSNPFRLGWDAAFSSGNQLNVWVSIEHTYTISGDTYTLNWSGSWAGSSSGTLTESGHGTIGIYAAVIGTQAYNSTTTTHFSVSGLYTGQVPTVDMMVTLGPLSPNAPTIGTATRVDDTQINLTWSNNPTSDRPIDHNYVYRDDNTWGVNLVADLAGSATSFSDTGLVADRKFRYRVDAANSAGVASSGYTAYVYTTPAPVSNVVASKDASGNIVLTWTNNSTYASEARVEVWNRGGTQVSTSMPWATTYTVPTPDPAVPHTYSLRVISPTGYLASAWVDSNTVMLLARPNAPTNLTMAAQYQSTTIAAADAVGTITLGWRHNPVDSSAQTAYELVYQVSADGGSTWAAEVTTGQVFSATASHILAADTFINNWTIRYRVRTWGLYDGTAPTYSDWSDYNTFTTNARPTAALTGSGNWTTSTLTQTGSYLDAEGSAQTGATWTLRDGGGSVLETISAGAGDPKLTTVTFATKVSDGLTYTVTYQVRDGVGMWSTVATKAVSVVYSKPPQPTITAVWSDPFGAVTGQITNPAGSPAVAYNIVYRDGVPLALLSNVPANSTFVDRIPPLNSDITYTVVAVSSLPSSSIPSAGVTVTTTSNRIWLNGGLGMTSAVDLPYNPVLSGHQERSRKWVGYDNRPDEVMYTGVQRQRSYKINADAEPGQLQALLALEDLSQTVCYRDPSGRRAFGGISGGVDYTDGSRSRNTKAVSVTLRAAAYSE